MKRKMKIFKNLLEDKDYILSEEEKFVSRGYNISLEKKAEMKDYYGAYEHEKSYIEDGDYQLLGASQNFITKRTQELQDLEDSNIIFALKRMSEVRAVGEVALHQCIEQILMDWKYAPNTKDTYYVIKQLVDWINAYWDITGEKPSNRIAWGWSKGESMENPNGYLYGCIRNYLRRNNKFDQKQFNRIWFGNFR